MPAKKHKVKFQQQSKKKKTRRSLQPAAARVEAAPGVEKVAVAVAQAKIQTPPAQATVIAVEKPELVYELRRIGILGGVMIIALVILALVL